MSDQEVTPGVNILDEQPAQQPEANQGQDPNVALSQILENLSLLQAVLTTFDNRIGQLEHFVSYLLMKDPEFKARQEAATSAAQAVADAQEAVNPTPETTSGPQA